MTDEQIKTIITEAKLQIQNKPEYGNTFHLSVDTAFLDQWSHVLDEMDVPHLLRSSPEGKFSCYINAVDDTIGPSSYAGDDAMIARKNIKEQFALW